MDIEKDIKLLAIRMLIALKHFYTFKELEDLLGISYQRLWRYIEFHTFPEHQTAKKILMTIKEKKLVENVIERISEDKTSLKDWILVRNTGFLELTSLLVADAVRSLKIGYIISAEDPFSIAFSSILASKMRTNLCIISDVYSDEEFFFGYARGDKRIKMLALPKSCVDKKKASIFVKFRAKSCSELEDYISFLRKIDLRNLKVVIVLSETDVDKLKEVFEDIICLIKLRV